LTGFLLRIEHCDGGWNSLFGQVVVADNKINSFFGGDINQFK
jgi:hypothetical protein